MDPANQVDVFVIPDGKEMFVQLKLVIPDAQLMECVPMGLVCALMVSRHIVLNSNVRLSEYLGRIHLPLMDGPAVKGVIKKLFCFSFDFNENW